MVFPFLEGEEEEEEKKKDPSPSSGLNVDDPMPHSQSGFRVILLFSFDSI